MVSELKLDKLLLDLGHDDFTRGTAYIREAVKMYKPGMAMTKELYPAIAKAHGSTQTRVERCMRHSLDKAWGRNDQAVTARLFGNTIDPQKGRPMLGEYVARLHRLAQADEGEYFQI